MKDTINTEIVNDYKYVITDYKLHKFIPIAKYINKDKVYYIYQLENDLAININNCKLFENTSTLLKYIGEFLCQI